MSRSLYWMQEELREVISSCFGTAPLQVNGPWDVVIEEIATAIHDGHLTASAAVRLDEALRKTR